MTPVFLFNHQPSPSPSPRCSCLIINKVQVQVLSLFNQAESSIQVQVQGQLLQTGIVSAGRWALLGMSWASISNDTWLQPTPPHTVTARLLLDFPDTHTGGLSTMHWWQRWQRGGFPFHHLHLATCQDNATHMPDGPILPQHCPQLYLFTENFSEISFLSGFQSSHLGNLAFAKL